MQSLRQMTDELLGVRLHASTVAQWNLVASVQEHIRIAVNDAIMALPTFVQEVYMSGSLCGNALVLPRPVRRVIRVDVAGDTATNPRELLHWEFHPSAHTNLIRVHDTVATGAILEVTYQYQQPRLPANLYLMTDSITSVACSAASVPSMWPAPPGYVEFHYTSGNYDFREVAQYHAVIAPGTFSGLVRGVQGYQMFYPGGSTVSACWQAGEDRLGPVMLMAKAGMYEAFVRHRSDYDQFTAMASMQGVTLEEMQVLVRDYEARGQVAYRMLGGEGLPSPAPARLRRGIPR